MGLQVGVHTLSSWWTGVGVAVVHLWVQVRVVEVPRQKGGVDGGESVGLSWLGKSWLLVVGEGGDGDWDLVFWSLDCGVRELCGGLGQNRRQRWNGTLVIQHGECMRLEEG